MNRAGGVLHTASRLVPIAIDISTLVGVMFVVPWLGDQIFAQSPINHALLLPGFVLIPWGIVSIRSMPSYSLDDRKSPSLLPVCLAFFLVIIYTVLYVHATDLGGSDQRNEGATIIIFFVFLLPVLGAFSWPTQPAQPNTMRSLLAHSVGLVSVNYLTLLGAAIWEHFHSLPTSEGATEPTGISFLVLFTILYLLFLAFFGLPRIYLLRATGDKIGLAIYLGWIAVFLWNKVPPLD